jgi:Sulfatase
LSKATFRWSDLCVISALYALAVTQPIYEILEQNGQFFVFKGATPGELALFVVILSLGLPFLLGLIPYILNRFNPVAATIAVGVLINLLLLLLICPEWKRIRIVSPSIDIFILFAFCAVVSYGYFRLNWLRSFFLFLIPAIFIVPLVFIFSPAISRIIFAGKTILPNATLKAKSPVVMIVFDEFPVTSLMNEQKLLDAEKFPNFAQLLKNATWYRNATTVAERTQFSLSAILTGLYPERLKLAISQDYPNNLFTLLGSSYEMNVFETATRLWPESIQQKKPTKTIDHLCSILMDLSLVYLHIVLPHDWIKDLPNVSETWGDFWTNREGIKRAKQNTLDPFNHFINSIQPNTSSALYFVHVMLPHRPWQYLPSGKSYGIYPVDGMDVEHERWIGNEFQVVRGYQRHLLQVALVDTLLGRIINRLKNANLYDKSLIVVVADHGISFDQASEFRNINKNTYSEIIHVPLFIKTPYQKNQQINDWNVETIDILPTIAEALNINIPWHVEGVSAFKYPPNRKNKSACKFDCRTQIEFNSDLNAVNNILTFKQKTFGSGDISRLYFIGPCPDRIGETIQKKKTSIELKGSIKNFDAYKNVDLNSSFVPALISGEIHNAQTNSIQIAIAINNVVRAVTVSVPLKENTQGFSSLIPENSLKNGPNKVDLYELPSCNSNLELIPLTEN